MSKSQRERPGGRRASAADRTGTKATKSTPATKSREEAEDGGGGRRPEGAPQPPPTTVSHSDVARRPLADGQRAREDPPSASRSAGSSPRDIVSAGPGAVGKELASAAAARMPGNVRHARPAEDGQRAVASGGASPQQRQRGPGNSSSGAAAAAHGQVARSQATGSSKPQLGQEREQPPQRRAAKRLAGGPSDAARAPARASLASKSLLSAPQPAAVSSSASAAAAAAAACRSSSSSPPTRQNLKRATIGSSDLPLHLDPKKEEEAAAAAAAAANKYKKDNSNSNSNANSTNKVEPKAKINSFKSRDSTNSSVGKASERRQQQQREHCENNHAKLNKVNAIKGSSTLLARPASGKLVSSSSSQSARAAARETITTGKPRAPSVKQQTAAAAAFSAKQQQQHHHHQQQHHQHHHHHSQFASGKPTEHSNNTNHRRPHHPARQPHPLEAQAFLPTQTLANKTAAKQLLHTSTHNRPEQRKTSIMADQAVIDKLEAGYAKLQAATPEQCHSLLKKYLSREVLDKAKTKKTAMGATLLDVAQSGFENLDSGVGIYAPDAESYTLFADLFNPIIEDYHGGFKATDKHPQSDFGDINTLVNLDPNNEFVISTRVRCGRSLQGYPFNPCLTEAQYKEMEQKVSSTLKEMAGDLAGTYYPLTGMTKETQQQLIDDHFLFKEGDRFLQAANACRYWPTGRGIYHNVDKTFLVWVNEEDHLRIISMQKGGDLKTIYDRLIRGAKSIEAKVPFSRDDRLGFLTFCPTNLGTTIRASVHIKLPKLAADRKKLEEVASRYNLQVRGTSGEHTESVGGVYDISNKRRLGLTEYQAVREMQDGILELIKIEKSL